MRKIVERQYRRLFPKRIKNYNQYKVVFQHNSGLEIGGPSHAFTNDGFLPIYKVVKSLDGCNFSSNTIWEGQIKEGENYKFGNRKGWQYISDAVDLSKIETAKYDFILSCHSLEHLANPIKALTEWKRVLREKGHLLLIVPHKDQTFDHKRPLTTLTHLIDDYKKNITENDTTHFEEVIQLHDISLDAGVSDIDYLKQRTLDNFNNRCVHQHVFNTPLAVRLADYMNFTIIDVQHFNPFHIILFLQKNETEKAGNQIYLNPAHKIYQKTKFPSDKTW